MIRLGYAGINTEMLPANKRFRLANYSLTRMLESAKNNLRALKSILIWNLEHQIYLFRINSGLIPFGSHIVNKGEWRVVFGAEFKELGIFIRRYGMRVSMHPGQYTVLNTPNPRIYIQSINDLNYHCTVLEAMELDWNHKIILHGGGIYGNKQNAIRDLKSRLTNLQPSIQKRLLLENDERSFSAEDIYEVCVETAIPAVLDIFHHQCKGSFKSLNTREIILKFKNTWPAAVRQKIHYSNQQVGKRTGAHSQSIDINKFNSFYEQISDLELDIMIETKDKQDSVLKLRRALPLLK